MRDYKLTVHVADPETGQMVKLSKHWHVQGADTDEAFKKARALMAELGHPPVRAINKLSDGGLVVYCAKSPGTEPVQGLDMVFKAPPG